MRTHLQNTFLYLIAIFLTALIFITDLKTPSELAIGALYCLVILYSWLLPGKYVVLIIGALCSTLIIIPSFFSEYQTAASNFGGINYLISLISCWICVIMISLAKSSMTKLEEIIGEKESKVDEKTEELFKLNLTLEEKVQQRTNELAQSNKDLEQFAYVTSHDLLEPVNTIKSFTELIYEENTKLDENLKQYLDNISDSSERMSELISDLLNYSRLGREKSYSKIDLNELVENVLEDLNSSIKESSAELYIDALPSLVGLKVELRMLFQNLISNALKFRKLNSSPKIEISCEKRSVDWLFSVTDNGIGISDKFKERVFTIFKRLHTVEDYEGTGIGLAHCKKIVELHEGKIWIGSKPGEGTTVYFTLRDMRNA